MSDPDLLEWARTHARRDGPETSHAAARQSKGLAGEHHRLILLALTMGDMTAADVEWFVGLETHKVNRRTGEMLKAGLIELTGETRTNAAGRRMRVFRRVATT